MSRPAGLAALAAEATRIREANLRACLDPAFPLSRPAAHQLEFFSDLCRVQYRVIRGGNQSSKTACTSRELSWCMTGTHPGWERHTSGRCPICKTPPTCVEGYDFHCDAGHEWRDWGSGVLTALIVGQSRAAMEKEIWQAKMKPFFPEKEWHEESSGGYISAVINKKNDDRIIFLSHADSSPKNIKYLQTFVANFVLLDEMPTNVAVFEEIMRRADSRKAPVSMGFTPKVFNGAVKRFVDSLKPPQGKVYRFSKFQNPLFVGKEKEEYAKLEGLPEHTKNCILFGDWMPGDGLVFWYEPEKHSKKRHPLYSTDWPHVLIVDPATESKLGFLLAHRVPDGLPLVDGCTPPGHWSIQRAEYVEGVYTPHRIVTEVEERAAPYNLIERVSDPAASWFIRAAEDRPDGPSVHYSTVSHKNMEGRKDAMIASAQQSLGQTVWIEDGHDTVYLTDELGTMARSPDTGKIRKSRKYHLIDCLNYFVDCLPYRLPAAPLIGLEAQRRSLDEWRNSGSRAIPQELVGLREMEKKFNRIRISMNTALGRRLPRFR